MKLVLQPKLNLEISFPKMSALLYDIAETLENGTDAARDEHEAANLTENTVAPLKDENDVAYIKS